MSAKLVAYGYVPPGFEMLIDDPDIETGRVWNLWFNIKLTDDPESWDNEIRLVNEMQARLGGLSMDHRLIRAQMAEFCRLNPLFPWSIDLLCEEIGTGRFSRPMILGCEGRGLLKALGHHPPQSVSEQRKGVLAGYVRSLDKWLAQDSPESLLESKVFGFLGRPTNAKKGLVEKLLSTIDPDAASISSLKRLAEDICTETQGELVLEGAGRPLSCLKCDACSDGEAGPVCGCSCGMLIESILLCVGMFEGRAVFEEFGRFTQESILTYCLAINSWLQAMPVERVDLTITRYIADGLARQLAARVHALLGEKNEVKEWLVACLLKTVKDNQRWHKRAELIDRFPQATSWFKEHRPA